MPFKLPALPKLGSAAEHKSENASLDDILPKREQRLDLLALVVLCSSSMRKTIALTLSTGGTSSEAGDTEPQTTEDESAWQWLGMSSSSRMSTMRQAGLQQFDTWSHQVIGRIGEALKISEDSANSVVAQFGAINDGSDAILKPDVQQLDSVAKANGYLHFPFPKHELPSHISGFDEKQRALVLGMMLFLTLSLERYSSFSRILVAYICMCLELPYDVLASEETTTAATLLEAASKTETIDAEEARKKQASEGANARKWKIGLATVAGAAVIGITGGLAAPVILGLAGTIMGGIGLGGLATLLGATIANPITIAALFGAFGGRMSHKAMEAYSKEVQDFSFIPIADIKPNPNLSQSSADLNVQGPAHKLRVAIGISGWVTKESDISLPWRIFSTVTLEPFALQYEQEALTSFSTALTQMLKDTAYGYVQSYAIRLVVPTLAAAMAPLGLLKFGRIIDNPFTIALERSDKAGKVLAHALMDKVQGERPVTLIGFSMGARVIYSCLHELAVQKAFDLVENAVLIGAPTPSAESSWRCMRAVVAGRLVNVYTDRDVLLGYLYRARNAQLGVAGLSAIDSVPRIENKNVSHIVSGHNQYYLAIGRILSELDFVDLDLEQIEQEDVQLKQEKEYEKEIFEEAKKNGQIEDLENEKGEMVMDHIDKYDKTLPHSESR